MGFYCFHHYKTCRAFTNVRTLSVRCFSQKNLWEAQNEKNRKMFPKDCTALPKGELSFKKTKCLYFITKGEKKQKKFLLGNV